MSEIISEVSDSTFELLQVLQNKEVDICSKIDAINDLIKKFSLSNEKIKDFNKDLEWFNVSRPLTLNEDLKGKVVILDFFTYCCINCLHILPNLKQIENEFSIEDGVVVVGVHSAKFDNEKDSSNLLSAIQRYEINHPVVNDGNATMWTDLGITCWPTLLILSPSGQPLFHIAGESFKEEVILITRTVVSYFKNSDKREIVESENMFISEHSLPIAPSVHLLPPSLLLFPGKVATHGDCLAISDSGHNRILITNTKGIVKLIIGGPLSGFLDGNAAEARFSSPQGVEFFGPNILFVSDTGNHAIRKIDISQGGQVTTIAGVGFQGDDKLGGKKNTDQSLNSPWDLCFVKVPKVADTEQENGETGKEVLLIAMAGSHQIWAYFLEDAVWWRGKSYSKGQCVAVAGSGAEENRNNAYPHAAAFAQPSGICYSPECVFVADSESSSIRRIWLSDGKVTAVIGGNVDPQMLFAFGDVDGKGRSVRLQHPLGVVFHKGNLYVADTYNHKVKVVHVGPEGGVKEASTKMLSSVPKEECVTLLGTGHPGDSTGSLKTAQLNEPGGLCISEDGSTIFIADTNNHCIKKIDLNQNIIEKLKISYMESSSALSENLTNDSDEIIKFNPNGGSLTLIIKISLSKELRYTEEAPQKMFLTFDSDGKWPSNSCNILTKGIDGEFNPVKVLIPSSDVDAQNTIQIKLSFYVCRNHDSCFAKIFFTNLSIVRTVGSPTDQSVEIKHSIN